MAGNYLNALGLRADQSKPATDAIVDKAITEKIIGCAIEVHRQLGPGLLEGTYEAAMCIELAAAGLKHVRQPVFPVVYKQQLIGEYRLDLIVENAVVVEIKSVDRFDPIFEAQVLTYLKVTGKRIGLLINFNSRLVKDGIRRFILEPHNAL
jgi:GxxExxY protein